ncbi:MAG: hypothetical protein ACYDCN_08500 [Bacteroidia bacterium]
MEKVKTQERTQIEVLNIKQSGEKVLFQIRLPKNAEKITGILVTVQPINKNQLPTDTPLPPFPSPVPIKEPVIILTPMASVKIATAATVATASATPVSNTKTLFPLEQVIL